LFVIFTAEEHRLLLEIKEQFPIRFIIETKTRFYNQIYGGRTPPFIGNQRAISNKIYYQEQRTRSNNRIFGGN